MVGVVEALLLARNDVRNVCSRVDILKLAGLALRREYIHGNACAPDIAGKTAEHEQCTMQVPGME